MEPLKTKSRASRKGNIISNSVPRPKGDYGTRSGQSESLKGLLGFELWVNVDFKMKSEGLKESLTALKSHVKSLVIESLGDRVLGIWMVDFKMKSGSLSHH